MAIQDNELYSENTRGPLPAIQPADGPGSVVTRTFAAGSETLPVAMPLCVVPTTGYMKRCDPDSGNAYEQVVQAFVYPDAITLNANGEVLGTVMLKGSVKYSEISAHLTQLTGTEQELKDMLRAPAVNDRGLFIDGLTKAGGNSGLS